MASWPLACKQVVYENPHLHSRKIRYTLRTTVEVFVCHQQSTSSPSSAASRRSRDCWARRPVRCSIGYVPASSPHGAKRPCLRSPTNAALSCTPEISLMMELEVSSQRYWSSPMCCRLLSGRENSP